MRRDGAESMPALRARVIELYVRPLPQRRWQRRERVADERQAPEPAQARCETGHAHAP
jgi:hypothetical protein